MLFVIDFTCTNGTVCAGDTVNIKVIIHKVTEKSGCNDSLNTFKTQFEVKWQ